MSKTELLTERQVVADLRARLLYSGQTMKEFGQSLGGKRPISAGYLNDVLKGRKRPGPRILKAIGLVMQKGEVLYRRVRPTHRDLTIQGTIGGRQSKGL